MKGKEVFTYEDFENNKFSSFEAKVHYERVVEVNKGFIPKKGMNFNSRQDGISNVIKVLGWKRFIKEHKIAIESLIWEFYANVPDIVDNMVKVKNLFVPFKPNDINTHYLLVNVREGQ